MAVVFANGREWVGDEDSREDVTHVANRRLVLRAIDSSIATERQIGALVAEVAQNTRAVVDMRASLGELVRLIKKTDARVDTVRDKIPSAHEIAVEIADEITHPGFLPPKTDSDIRALARDEQRRVDNENALAALENERKERKERATIAVAVVGTLAAVAEAVKLIFGH